MLWINEHEKLMIQEYPLLVKDAEEVSANDLTQKF